MKKLLLNLLCVLPCLVGAYPLEAKWQQAPQLPYAVARPFYGLSGDELFVAGGSFFLKNGTKSYSTSVAAYNVLTKSWRTLPDLKTGTAEGAFAMVAGKLYCFGGRTSAGETDVGFVLDAQGTYTAIKPFPGGKLVMPATAVWETKIYVVGGMVNGSPSNAVWCYDTELDTWSELPPIPGAPRVQAVAGMQNGDQKKPILVVFGGSTRGDDGRPQAIMDGYGYQGGVWKTLKDSPCCTVGSTLVPVGDQHLLLVGGFDGEIWDAANRLDPKKWSNYIETHDPADFKWNRTLYAYHTVTGMWTPYGELPADILPRCGAVVATYTQTVGRMKKEVCLLLAGGEIKPTQRTAQMHIAPLERTWKFSYVSWIVIGVYFLTIVGMGVYFMLKEKTDDTYFRGGRSIPWFVAGMSIFATMLSSITFISIPTLTYISDWRYFPMAIAILALAPIVIYFYLPFFCRLNITSAYEYLESRFNAGIRLFGSAVFNIFMVCRIAVVTLLPAIALNAVTDIDVDLCILLCGVATILYCYVGGVEASIWSDFVQGIVLLGGAVTVLGILVYSTTGGVSGFFSIAGDAGKLKLLDFRFLFREPVFWVVAIQGLVSNLSSYTSDQCVVQRYITTTNEKAAARSIWFNGGLSVLASVVFYAIGSALYTYYTSHPENMDITMPKSDSIFPLFMAMELNPIISGLIIAAIFAATISTLSANLNAAATAITFDFVKRTRPSMTGKQQVNCGRVCVIVVGVLGVFAALMLARVDSRSLFDVFQNFIGMLTAGLSALFFLGIFVPRVSGTAAIIGLVANYVVCYSLSGPAWLKLLCPAYGQWLATSAPHPFVFGGIGLVVCVILAYVLSFIFPNRKSLIGLTFFSKPQK